MSHISHGQLVGNCNDERLLCFEYQVFVRYDSSMIIISFLCFIEIIIGYIITLYDHHSFFIENMIRFIMTVYDPHTIFKDFY